MPAMEVIAEVVRGGGDEEAEKMLLGRAAGFSFAVHRVCRSAEAGESVALMLLRLGEVAAEVETGNMGPYEVGWIKGIEEVCRALFF